MHVDVHPGPRGHTHLDLRYHLTAPPVDPAPPTGESPDVAWFSWPQAIAIAEPGLEGVLRAYQPGTPTIRPALVADAAGCARVYVRSKAFGIAEVPEPHTESEIAAWIADTAIPEMQVWVADLDGVVVGQIMLAPRLAAITSTSTHRGWVAGWVISSWHLLDSGNPMACNCGRSRATPERVVSTNATVSSRSSSPTGKATRNAGPTCATRLASPVVTSAKPAVTHTYRGTRRR